MRNLDRLRTGDEVLRFMQENLVHGPGSYEGEPWRPLLWQADLVHALYDPRRPDGRRLIDRALLLTPKGAGKTELAGALAVVELVIRESAEVVIAAATWQQVGLLKASADGCCSHTNSALADLVEITEAEIRLKNTTSRIVRVASDAGGNDGLRPTCLIRDEVHEWNTPSRERNHLVLSNGLAKRGGLQLDISTVGADRESLLGRYDAYCGGVGGFQELLAAVAAPGDLCARRRYRCRISSRACSCQRGLERQRGGRPDCGQTQDHDDPSLDNDCPAGDHDDSTANTGNALRQCSLGEGSPSGARIRWTARQFHHARSPRGIWSPDL